MGELLDEEFIGALFRNRVMDRFFDLYEYRYGNWYKSKRCSGRRPLTIQKLYEKYVPVTTSKYIDDKTGMLG